MIYSKKAIRIAFLLLLCGFFACNNLKVHNLRSEFELNSLLKSKFHLGLSAHRGNSGIAPENTLASFKEILNIGVDYIEIDVRTTKDNKLVIFHDSSLNRTTDGVGQIKNFTLIELKKLSAGKGFGQKYADERIPTLEETLELISNWNSNHKLKTNLYVDCKDAKPEVLIKELKKHKLAQNAVFYGSDEYLLKLKKAFPKAKVMPALKDKKDITNKISSLKPYAFDVNWSILNEDLVATIHSKNIKVFSDVLGFYDVPKNYKRATELGIDIIQTDYVQTVYDTLLK